MTVEFCSLCTGPLVALGDLGSRVAYRCRNCGMVCTRPRDEDEDPTEPCPVICGEDE